MPDFCLKSPFFHYVLNHMSQFAHLITNFPLILIPLSFHSHVFPNFPFSFHFPDDAAWTHHGFFHNFSRRVRVP